MRLLDPQLQAFLAIIKYKTVHGAAAHLHITQTAVTQRIRALEIKLSTTLFTRSRRGMMLTSEGKALQQYCEDVQELEGIALSNIIKIGKEKNTFVCINGPTTIMHTRVIPRCITVMKNFPRLFIQFAISDDDHAVKALRSGESQLAIIERSFLSIEMEYQHLIPENYILVSSSQWKNRKLSEIIKNETIIDFDQQDKMTFNYLKYYGLFDLANKERHFVNKTDTLALMITEGLGYGVLPAEVAKPYLANKKLIALNGQQSYPHLLSLAWFPRHQPPDYFSALIQACV